MDVLLGTYPVTKRRPVPFLLDDYSVFFTPIRPYPVSFTQDVVSRVKGRNEQRVVGSGSVVSHRLEWSGTAGRLKDVVTVDVGPCIRVGLPENEFPSGLSYPR